MSRERRKGGQPGGRAEAGGEVRVKVEQQEEGGYAGDKGPRGTRTSVVGSLLSYCASRFFFIC